MIKNKLVLIIGLWVCALQAQETDSSEFETFEEVLISADRYGAKRSQSVQEIEVISSKKLSEMQGATLADALIQSGKVYVQKSQMGGGSPVLRGFEASRVLLLIDGVRMNNATFRAGHLQDVISIDPFALERMEVNFGSGSTLYGSDALGGALYMKTRDPRFSKFETWVPRINLRYQSATRGIVANASLEYRAPKTAWLLNITHSDWGDLRVGSNSFTDIDTHFGLQPYKVVPLDTPVFENNQKIYDRILLNEDSRIQPYTSYSQTDLLLKGKWDFRGAHDLNIQASLAAEIPRFDRLQYYHAPSTVTPRPAYQAFNYGNWSYAPQNRFFTSYGFEPFNQKGRIRFSYQRFEVGRVSRAFNHPNLRKQEDVVNMSAINYDRKDELMKWDVRSGVEFVFNDVRSKGIQIHQETGQISSAKSRYADSLGMTTTTSVFTQLRRKFNKVTIITGARLTHYDLQANYKKDNAWDLPLEDVGFSHIAPSYNFGIITELSDGLLLKTSFNQAFRNPNIDDMSKVFESQRGLKLLLPSTDLKPEFTRTVDININYRFQSKLYVEAGVYRTWIRNLMSDVYGEVAGKDSFEWDGLMTPIFQIQNVGAGHITGAFVSVHYRVMKNFLLKFSLTETNGKVQYLGEDEFQPLDHIPPLYGSISLKWKYRLCWLECQYLFNGEKPLSEYSMSGEDNLNYTPGFINGVGNVNSVGNPSWGIWNFRSGYQFTKRIHFDLAVENVLDLRYRTFASGIAAAGRNILVTARYDF